MPFEHIRRELHRAVRRAGIASEVTAATVVDASRRAILEIMGSEIGSHVEPLYVRNGTLTVRASSAIVVQEVKFREHDVVEKTNKIVGHKAVRRLLYLI